MLIKQELTGDFSGVYDKWLREKSEDIETSIKDASNIIFSDYEKPGTNDKEERANNAWILYQIVEENKCYE